MVALIIFIKKIALSKALSILLPAVIVAMLAMKYLPRMKKPFAAMAAFRSIFY
jgi:hypothetical protein